MQRLFDSRVLLGLGIATGAVLGRVAPVGASGEVPVSSPIRLYGLAVGSNPTELFSASDLQLMADRFEIVSGLDGWGYQFPGAIDSLRALDPDVTVLTYWEAMGVQGNAARLAEIDLEEPAFIHSGDPASLTAIEHDGQTLITFRQDARHRTLHQNYAPPGVEAYVVEFAASQDDVFMPLGAPVLETGQFIYQVNDDVVDPQRVYRVRTRLLDGSEVNYSWTASVDPTVTTRISSGCVFGSGQMSVICYGDCPADPADVVLEADLDNDRQFEPSESFAFTNVEDLPDGGRCYSGQVAPFGVRFSYRIAVTGSSITRLPAEGAYQISTYNNRIQMRHTGSYLVWPDNKMWMFLSTQRLSDALSAGYNGMKLDFVLDTLDQHWTATGVPPDWQGTADTRIRDGIKELLISLHAQEPSALLSIQGYFVAADSSSHFENLAHADVGEIEYFAVGNFPSATTLQANTGEAFEAVWQTRAQGRTCAVFYRTDLSNYVGRLKGLAAYLLVMDEHVLLDFETVAVGGSFVYLPEWDVPLGEPTAIVNDWGDLMDPSGQPLLSREFESGLVVFNTHPTDAVTIELGESMYRLSVSGGLAPSVGGDGQAQYTAVRTVTLDPQEPAILVRNRPSIAASFDPHDFVLSHSYD